MTDTLAPDAIASVSLTQADRDPDGFADRLGRSFEEYGFAVLADHGIPQDLIERAEEQAKALFALPDATKRGYALGQGGARGYTPFGIETAKGHSAHDLKEFWHVGRELAAGHRFRDVMADNVWPDEEVPGFRQPFLELYDAFDAAGLKVLRAIARYLKVDEEYFTDTVRDGNSVMRLLHYPPQTEPTGEHIRAGAHEDINTITLLIGAEEAGLELKTRDGRWIPVSPRPGELVINIGDMLQRLTNGKLRSTPHRVVNPAPDRASNARYSMPFFLHFRPDFMIEALPGTVPAGEQPKWPPISSHDYLMERLREIKLA